MQTVGQRLFEFRTRVLTLVTKPEFKGTAEGLRLGITGHWKDHDVLHGHDADGSSLYRLPPVRYLPAKAPRVIALGAGIEIMPEMYDSLGETIRVRRDVFVIKASELRDHTVKIGLSDDLHEYHNQSLWLALNQDRYKEYIRMGLAQKRREILERTFIGNLLSLSKGVGYTVPERVMVRIHRWREKNIVVKGTPMLGFDVDLTTNFILPEDIGIGRHATLGFGRFTE